MTAIKVQTAAHLRSLGVDDDLGGYRIRYSNDYGTNATIDVPDEWEEDEIDEAMRDLLAQGLIVPGGANDGASLWRYVKDGWVPTVIGPIMPVDFGALYVPGDTYPLMGIDDAVMALAGYGSGIIVGHVDTWVDAAHDWLTGLNIVQGGRPKDSETHGTHTMGTIAGKYGILRHPKQVYSFNGLPGGSGSEELIAQGIDWCTDHGVSGISMSLGGPGASRLIDQANERAKARGVTIVSAAGNAGGQTNPAGSPARSSTWQVLACDRSLVRASFSDGYNWNTPNRLYGQGVDVVSSMPGNRTGMASGTSMATPHVYGGLMLLRNAGIEVGVA